MSIVVLGIAQTTLQRLGAKTFVEVEDEDDSEDLVTTAEVAKARKARGWDSKEVMQKLGESRRRVLELV